MHSSVRNPIVTLGIVAIGVALAAGGIYIGHTDDAPGAGMLGILLLVGSLALAVRIARRST